MFENTTLRMHVTFKVQDSAAVRRRCRVCIGNYNKKIDFVCNSECMQPEGVLLNGAVHRRRDDGDRGSDASGLP